MSSSVNSTSISSQPLSQATVLIATDVFGHTPAVASLVRQLGTSAIVVSPWDTPEPVFRTEQDAYQAFIIDGGIARYAEKLQRICSQHDHLRFIIGFSAGASALWINSEHVHMQKIHTAVLFYGSRIRDYRDIKPACPVRLIFAEHEVAFATTELVSDLHQRGYPVELVKGTKHGFMNAYSRGYCVKSQTRYTAELIALLHAKANKVAA
ncbi:hypothetical protein [Undibacterium sp. RuRC25W]|uniref:hypothetical protein n=1 Tax=Undibacterium sp. RuRC25W TaxID=3413047 RepID=UPI003BF34387